jgi:hypothetical protein
MENVCKYFILKNKERPLPHRKVAKFLNKELSEEQVSILADHLDFSNMKDNPAVNKVRSGFNTRGSYRF